MGKKLYQGTIRKSISTKHKSSNLHITLAIKRRNLTQDARKNNDPKKWIYRIRKTEKEIKITVRIPTRFIVTPKPNNQLQMVTTVKPEESLSLKPGQWCQIWHDGHWCMLTDADFRSL